MTISHIMRVARKRTRRFDRSTAVEAVRAWHDLRTHPTLLWIPPLWRPSVGGRANAELSLRYGVPAVERNLVVDIDVDDHGQVRVTLATGPLSDRPLADGVDPVNPAATLDSRLRVSAATFEDAVVRLRDTVVRELGPPPNATRGPAGSRKVALGRSAAKRRRPRHSPV